MKTALVENKTNLPAVSNCFRQKLPQTFAIVSVVLTILMQFTSTRAADCITHPLLVFSREGDKQLRLHVVGDPGINYALECSSNGILWTRIVTNRSAAGIFTYDAPILPAVTQQFFRALSVDSADGLGGHFIFDGESFTGWDGANYGTFRAANCAIVSGSRWLKPEETVFLCATRRYTNFILRLEFKLASRNGLVNSGVQIRSERVAGSAAVRGYQADLGDGSWGTLWDEARRNVVLAGANQAEMATILKTNEWNSYVICAKGSRLQFWINGHQTIDYTESDAAIPQSGIIGLETYSGLPTEASFRHITVEVLP